MKLTKNVLVFLAVMFCCSSVVIAQPLFIKNIGMVKKGMSRPEVVRYLGDQGRSTFSESIETIHYQKHENVGGSKTKNLLVQGAADTVINKVGLNMLTKGLGTVFNFAVPAIVEGGQALNSKTSGKNVFYTADITLTNGAVTSISYSTPGNVQVRANPKKVNRNAIEPMSSHTDTKRVAPESVYKEKSEVVIIETSDKYGHAPEGKVFEVNGIGHEIKYCANVVGNPYNVVDESDVKKMDKCVPAF